MRTGEGFLDWMSGGGIFLSFPRTQTSRWDDIYPNHNPLSFCHDSSGKLKRFLCKAVGARASLPWPNFKLHDQKLTMVKLNFFGMESCQNQNAIIEIDLWFYSYICLVFALVFVLRQISYKSVRFFKTLV